ncbi:hypothetical protein GCM10010978_18290 [Compostibacillus humi]|uniref:DUF378 domain-containing protein n=1 Tax=Compostibacillus humi TaxID=1245525 RepID=A0A8J2TK48_9BACI|nr:DUF378 domain-containing protein [Compostibacillus humi]GFZ76967.1 hypothetical protein GCM10010978_18290 [Compostibacillus humi]HLT55647.1 DUF378 domain-containing protein [Bacillota bacterium]
MTFLRNLAIALMVIGAINWGLIAFFQFDLVAGLFGGQDAFLSRVVYGLVGLSGLYYVISLFTGERSDLAVGNPDFRTEFAEDDDFADLTMEDDTSYRRPTERDE